MGQHFKKHQRVQWKWLGRVIQGTVEEIYVSPVVKVIKEKQIKRNGSPEKPAYYVKSDAGNFALKLESELQKAQLMESAWSDCPEE